MSWEKKDKLWPEHIVYLENGMANVDEILRTNPEIIYSIRKKYARDMLVFQKRSIWGKDGEFALGYDYNVMDILPHPDQNHSPLNAYGMRMLRDYMITNNIDIPQE